MRRADPKRLLRCRHWRLVASETLAQPVSTRRAPSLEPTAPVAFGSEGNAAFWRSACSYGSFALSSEAAGPSQEASAGGCTSCSSSERTPDGLFCQHCGALQAIDSKQSFFSLMCMKEPSFKINDSLLDKQYKDLQRRLHPDRFSNRPEAEQRLSEDASALVNEAFSTLKQPLRRAEYMLQQRGIEGGEDIVEDPDLLMGIMEAREAVEAADSPEELQKFAVTFQRQADDCVQGLLVAFQRDDIEGAKQLTTLLRYVTRVQTAILEKTD